jgi:hypothetical protein
MQKLNGIHGVEVRGEHPRILVLNDGSVLSLDANPDHGHGGDWVLAGPDGSVRDDHLSVAEALALAGDEFAGYVRVRTRAEAEWLRTVAEWCGQRADLLAGELENGAAEKQESSEGGLR